MAITRLTNEQDGWGYFIPAGTPFDQFPEEALALLDERDRAIYLASMAMALLARVGRLCVTGVMAPITPKGA